MMGTPALELTNPPSNQRFERIGRRLAHHGRALRAAGRSTAGRWAAEASALSEVSSGKSFCIGAYMADLDTALTGLIEGIQHLNLMSHSGIAIATAAILDSQLERALKRAMRPLSKTLYHGLFDPFRPLSTFSSKIVMAYVVGIISGDTFKELEKIRQIRNAFAHSSGVLHFGSANIAPIFSTLKRPNIASKKPAEVFVACPKVIDTSLEEYLNSMGERHT
jgi:hypothetical protein